MNNYCLYFFCLLLPLLSISNPSPEIKVQQIDDGVYLYQSFAEYKGQQISANGLILESADEVSLEAYYPGPGHTIDNTVIYLNDKDILYGGCFIKSASATSLGNTEEAANYFANGRSRNSEG